MRAGSRLPPSQPKATIPPEVNATKRDQEGEVYYQRSTVLDNITSY